jgi:hypothetical protein
MPFGFWASMLSLAACDSDPPTPPGGTTDSSTETPVAFPGKPLEGALLLRRISLDIRGLVPSLDELDTIEADPEALQGLIDGYLADERWEERLVDLFAERWLTRVDVFNVSQDDYHLDASLEYAFERAVGEEPLRLLAYVAFRDRPWSEVVTAEYTMANELLASIWPLDYPDGATGWQKSFYTDGRPAGGVVMTNGLWWRYYTTPNNFSRSRAAALSRLLLCDDYLLRPIRFEGADLLSTDDLNEVTRTNPACAGCHSTLDPLASALFGFWWFDLYDTAEMTSYHAEREGLGTYYLGVEPAWFGVPIEGAAQLGDMIAVDDRFQSCVVEQLAEGLWRRGSDLSDFSTLQGLTQEFADSGQRVSVLVRAILNGQDYQVGSLSDQATDEDAARLTTRRIMSVEQLADNIAALTGFSWTYGGFDLMRNDEHGYRILAGGVDGHEVTAPEQNPTLTRALVTKRLAQAAAQIVVEEELVQGADPKLFTRVTLDDSPQDDVFAEQLVLLHRRLYGQTPDADRLALDVALWTSADELAGPESAWATLLTGLLRDPAFWTY